MDLIDAHHVWLDGHLIPQTPSKITFEHEDRTEVIKLANDMSLTVGHADGPMTISFEFKDTYQEYPWTFPEAHRLDWSDIFYIWKTGQYPFRFVVDRYYNDHDVSLMVLLTDWSYVEDAEDNNDFTFSITLMEYIPQTNQEISMDIQHHLIKNRTAQGWRSGGR